MTNQRLPMLNVNIDAMENNARVMCKMLSGYGISVAGVIKFSDGDIRVAKAYKDGGCSQIAVSRAVHLKAIKEALPDAKTLLTRGPTRAELEEVAMYADFSLHSDKDLLVALNDAAEKNLPLFQFFYVFHTLLCIFLTHSKPQCSVSY